MDSDNYLQLPDTVPSDLATILQQFSSVFDEPRSLPPSRSQDYAIPLQEGVQAIKVQPYR